MTNQHSYVEVTENIVVTPAVSTIISPGNPSQTSNVVCISLPEKLLFIDCGVDNYQSIYSQI